jgi:hypothetical protein
VSWQIWILVVLAADVVGWAWLLFYILFGGSVAELRQVLAMFREAGK